ncbi:helix-turn-helix transcriptional regulator [Dictyobacter vulcani]|uniref:Helix-turn-helix transcriptional regulator n=1 Tax=Dictyobacter vulcani TaxID=2607529 RepID=A0A5J4KK59_9CHLR|nr:LuxR C-terminal-related transcriptional regulator [Dictyobacter vulcani]GER88153.1 helix-turn-helix transcriptional regulator [Dictyobacter vulcani]
MDLDLNKQLLLATKLAIPPNYAPLIIPRLRLSCKLERGIHHPVTLISAPAGSGKTTLLNTWLQEYPANVAWLSLSNEDNDLQRFWRYCLAALAGIDRQLVQQASMLLDASVAIEEVLAALINAMVAYDRELLLALDDYQALQLPAIHQSVTFFIEHLPAHVHLFISTRVEPPLPLNRWRVRGQLLEIGLADLCFTVEESREFLVHAMHLQLKPAELTTLIQETEGWITGLRLMALSVQNKPAGEMSMDYHGRSCGINRDIAHYLTEEVLTTVPEDVLEFLLLTSILTRLQADLCNVVTGQSNGQQMLEWLEQANIFMYPIEEEGVWHRYHPLLAALLRQRSGQKYPERISELHMRASQWYEQKSMVYEAIEHALAGKAFERAADLLEAHAWPLWLRGHIPFLLDWLLKLQDQIALEQRPVLACLFAFIYLHSGKWRQYEQMLAIVQRNWRGKQDIDLQVGVLDLQAYHAICLGECEQSLYYTRQALEYSQHKPLQASFSHVLHGIAKLQDGDLQQAQLHFMMGKRSGIQSHRTLAVASALFYQGRSKVLQGKLHEALDLYQQCISICGEGLVWLNMQAHLQLGQIYLEWNELAQAEEYLDSAMCPGQRLGENALALIEANILAARLAWAHNNPEKALWLLEQAENRVAQLDNPHCALAEISFVRIHYWLLQGKYDLAKQWIEEHYPINMPVKGQLEQEYRGMMRARLLLAQAHPEEALTLLQKLLTTIQAQERTGSELQVEVLMVQAYDAMKDSRRSRQTLEQMLLQAEPGGYRRLFLEADQTMMTLLSDLYQRQQKRYSGDIPPHVLSYIHTLLLDFGCDVEPRDWCSWQKRAQRAQASLEQLSERELEVLKLIAEGHSNQEIARTLVVAESTIKTHLNNIYSKLNVNSRLQALTKAHTVGLLAF